MSNFCFFLVDKFVTLFTSGAFITLLIFVILLAVIGMLYKKSAGFRAFVGRIIKVKAGSSGFEIETKIQEPVLPKDGESEEKASPDEVEKKGDVKEAENGEWQPVTAEDWQIKMFLAFFRNEIDRATEAFGKLEEIYDKEGNKILKDRAKINYLRLKYTYGKDAKAIEEIEKFISDKELVFYAYRALGQCYEHASLLDKAIGYYRQAHSVANTDDERALSTTSLANSLYGDNQKDEAFKVIRESLAGINTDSSLSTVYVCLADLYKKEEDPEMRALALEKAVEYNPTDKSLLFSTAYSYSEKGYEELSLFHYKQSAQMGGEGGGLYNNMGLQYERLGMPIKSIEKYKESSVKGETLAFSNLANRYLGAGFKEEAQKLIDEAKIKEDVDPAVGTSLAKLHERSEEEDKKEKKVISEAQKQRKYFAKFAGAFFVQLVVSDAKLPETMLDEKDREFTVSLSEENIIKICWTTDGGDFKIKGTLTNKGARIVLYRKEVIDWTATPVKKQYQKQKEGFLYVSEGNNIEIMIKPKYDEGEYEFMSLKPCK